MRKGIHWLHGGKRRDAGRIHAAAGDGYDVTILGVLLPLVFAVQTGSYRQGGGSFLLCFSLFCPAQVGRGGQGGDCGGGVDVVRCAPAAADSGRDGAACGPGGCAARARGGAERGGVRHLAGGAPREGGAQGPKEAHCRAHVLRAHGSGQDRARQVPGPVLLWHGQALLPTPPFPTPSITSACPLLSVPPLLPPRLPSSATLIGASVMLLPGW